MFDINRFRKHEGDEQLDLFPEEEAQNRFFWKVAAVIIVLAFALLYAPLVFAEGMSVMLNNALLCDTEEQVKEQVDIFSAEPYATNPEIVEGCGYLTHPLPAVVTPTTTYENEQTITMLAIIQIVGFPPQYGYVAYEVKPPEHSI